MDKFDVTMLFETEYWNGNKIENMKSSHIVNTLLMLRRNAKDYKRQYEYFLIDHQDGKVLTTIDDINKIAKRDVDDWIIETPVYIALLEELEERDLDKYYDLLVENIFTDID